MGKPARAPRMTGRVVAPVLEIDPLSMAVREVIRLARATGPGGPPGANPRHLLLDVEVDGVRCVLLQVRSEHTDHDPMALSPREQEIARMVARGYANKTIAAVLDISTWTVGTYLRRIFAKLGVGTRAAMVARLKPDIVPMNPTTSI